MEQNNTGEKANRLVSVLRMETEKQVNPNNYSERKREQPPFIPHEGNTN